jgi:hypothetical protein
MSEGIATLQIEHDIELTDPQFELFATDKQFPAFVGGFGSGKTEALINRAIDKKLNFPKNDVAYYLPTYDLIGSIAVPRFAEKLETWGLHEGADFGIIASQRPRIEFQRFGQLVLRNMDNPARIVGYEVGHSLVDELDTLKTEDARNVWQKIMARNRQKLPNGAKNTIAVGTTPEGFRFVYERWKREPPSDEYQLIKASTYSNAHNLPSDYIDNLFKEYPTNLIQAYIEGEFVNLTAGAVYYEFDRELNGSTETIIPGENLSIGMDFNVGAMAAVVIVNRNGCPHAVAEFSGLMDTPAMIAAIKKRYPNHPIFIYPDASGDSRKSQNASVSDIGLLEQAKFVVFKNNSNPAVKDRILAVNRMIHANGLRRLFVNEHACPHLAEALEKQAYNDKGEPDKTSGFDHLNDAIGYFIHYRFPVVRNTAWKARVTGI